MLNDHSARWVEGQQHHCWAPATLHIFEIRYPLPGTWSIWHSRFAAALLGKCLKFRRGLDLCQSCSFLRQCWWPMAPTVMLWKTGWKWAVVKFLAEVETRLSRGQLTHALLMSVLTLQGLNVLWTRRRNVHNKPVEKPIKRVWTLPIWWHLPSYQEKTPNLQLYHVS